MAKPGLRLRIACAAVAFAASGAAVNAHAADPHDSDAIIAIYGRSIRLTRDMAETQKGALPQLFSSGDTQTLDCLNTLLDVSTEVSDTLKDVSDLANVASEMRDSVDEKYASSVRNIEAKGALGVFDLERREINQMAGMCPNQAVVQYKARDLIQLIDDASAELGALQAKGG